MSTLYSPVILKWQDACQYTIPAAEQSLKDVLRIAVGKEITDIGFLLEDREDGVVFCSKIIGDKKYDKVSFIPKGMVKEIIYLSDKQPNERENAVKTYIKWDWNKGYESGEYPRKPDIADIDQEYEDFVSQPTNSTEERNKQDE